MTKRSDRAELERMRNRPRSLEGLESIGPGSIVKIEREGEAFWCLVKRVEGTAITASVDSHLVFTRKHGFEYGHVITFGTSEIVDVYPARVQ